MTICVVTPMASSIRQIAFVQPMQFASPVPAEVPILAAMPPG